MTLCCSQFGGRCTGDEEEMTAEKCRDMMTKAEWEKVFEMTNDRNLYSNLCNSLFPTIHG